jgi:flagella basal body P-ring formation protein FlgA
MKALIKTASFVLLSALQTLLLVPHASAHAAAQSSAAQVATQGALQNATKTRQVAEQFLRAQASSLPGEISVTIGAIDPHLQLPACDAPEAFLPSGARAWGKTTVGVRCTVPAQWTVYISATVRVMSDYLVTRVPMSQGKIIGINDITKLKGDLSTLPAGILTDPTQAIGRTVARSLSSGMPLRQDALRNPQAVQQGQTVRLVTTGPGFSISAEAKALTAANEGQMVQAKTPGGQIVNGIAKLGGVVEVAY